jgi:hypothetical protein
MKTNKRAHLDCELPCGGQHQARGRLGRLAELGNVGQGRDGERYCLPGTGLGNPDKVTACQRNGPGLGLDGGRGGETNTAMEEGLQREILSLNVEDPL